jgi:hypothetical protein
MASIAAATKEGHKRKLFADSPNTTRKKPMMMLLITRIQWKKL